MSQHENSQRQTSGIIEGAPELQYGCRRFLESRFRNWTTLFAEIRSAVDMYCVNSGLSGADRKPTPTVCAEVWYGIICLVEEEPHPGRHPQPASLPLRLLGISDIRFIHPGLLFSCCPRLLRQYCCAYSRPHRTQQSASPRTPGSPHITPVRPRVRKEKRCTPPYYSETALRHRIRPEHRFIVPVRT